MPNNFETPAWKTKFWAGHEHVSLHAMSRFYLRSATLTFKQATWFLHLTGWSSGAKGLGRLPVPGRPTNLD